MSRMLSRSTVFASALLIIATGSYADTTYHRSDTPSDESQLCRILDIDVCNRSNSACYLVINHLQQGMIIGDIQQVIFQGFSKRVKLEQTFYGPSISLTYQCGKKRITLSNQQGACSGSAGDISANVVSADKGLKATLHTSAASTSANTPGHIVWEIRDTL